MTGQKSKIQNPKSKWLWFLAAPVILFLDYLTKIWAIGALKIPRRSIEVIPGYFDFSYAENTGVAFGIFDSAEYAWKPYALAALAIVAVAAIVYYYHKSPSGRNLLHFALGLTTGGILGNLGDRIFRGYVVDFIEWHIRDSFYWPNFNIADAAISVGIALLIIDVIKNPDSRQ
ncbi:MAG: signal peptidase II [Acidobacteriota bacterium]|jgi:signal peptidase II|nr:signal peptidase II [Acidobacteriota bacterium]